MAQSIECNFKEGREKISIKKVEEKESYPFEKKCFQITKSQFLSSSSLKGLVIEKYQKERPYLLTSNGQ